MRLLSPLVLVRIGQTNAGRIGHFAMDLELSLLKKRSYAKSSFFPIIFDFYFIDGTPSNSYLLQLWQKEITFYPRWLLKPIHRLNIKLPGSSKYDVFNGVTHTDLTLLDKFEPTLKMSQEDKDSANTALKEFGISQQDKIVCLCVRDSEYLRVTFPETDWNEHNHRDTDINTYVEAAELLAKMGYKVFRMGNIVRDKLESDSSSVIDYANSSIRSELLDIYLFSRADFVITTSTGMDFLGALFRIPIGIVNSVSLKSIYQGQLLKCYQPKEIMDTNSGQRLGLEELIERGYQRAYNQSDFASMNIGFIDNSSDDLCNFFSDMESLVRNMVTEQYSPKAIAILEKYKITNKNWAKLSPAWLTSHSYFLTPRRY
jgi:putative glycosyltransferase (TIGR04372 family)